MIKSFQFQRPTLKFYHLRPRKSTFMIFRDMVVREMNIDLRCSKFYFICIERSLYSEKKIESQKSILTATGWWSVIPLEIMPTIHTSWSKWWRNIATEDYNKWEGSQSRMVNLLSLHMYFFIHNYRIISDHYTDTHTWSAGWNILAGVDNQQRNSLKYNKRYAFDSRLFSTYR